MKRWLISVTVFIVSFIPMLAVGYFLLMLFAGPHGGLLPSFLHKYTAPFLWLIVIGVPLWLGSKAYTKLEK